MHDLHYFLVILRSESKMKKFYRLRLDAAPQKYEEKEYKLFKY